MKRQMFLALAGVIMLLAGCARQSQLVRWDAQRIESTNAREPYTLWENGTQ